MECKHCNLQISINKKFCNKNCFIAYKHKRSLRICHYCNKEFSLKNSAYEKRGNGKFCSRTCGTRKFSVDETFFDIIDTEEKAYWLGFIFGDGCQNGQTFTVTLAEKDKNHVEALKFALKSEHKIQFIKSKEYKKGHFNQNQYSLSIASKALCESLNKTGCIQHKTYIIEFPIINKNLEKHFIRGIFDADGTIGNLGKNRAGKKWSIYSASEKFINSIIEILNKNNINAKKYIKDNSKKNIKYVKGYNVYVCSNIDIKKLYEYLYKDYTICLERKREKFLT